MKDIPGLAWILGIFAIGSIALFIFTRMVPEPLPPAHSVWSDIETIRTRLISRTLKLEQQSSMVIHSPPFQIRIDRLRDQPVMSGEFARYLLQISGQAKVGGAPTWLGEGIAVGLVDLAPAEVVGNVRLAAVYRSSVAE